MKFESYLLRAIFVVCMLVCFATLGSMLFPSRTAATAAIAETQLDHAAAPVGALVPVVCTLAPCPFRR